MLSEWREVLEEAAVLRDRIIRSLKERGYSVDGSEIRPPQGLTKEQIRQLHQAAVEHRREKARRSLARVERDLLRRIASGDEVDPFCMAPRLVEVQSGSEEELLFRYASLHWSIPVSAGYGRRLRFLVVDEYNGKLIGLIGLTDPVFSLKSRDEWIGWTFADRKEGLKHVMEAFVLGAVPPYSLLLCGKLVAMLATSDTVRCTYERKYGGAQSRIRGATHDGRLALITTMSAFGRSSVYNRIRFRDRLLYQSVGFTSGFGEFHFASDLYEAMKDFAKKHCKPTAKPQSWGTGFDSRREVMRKCFLALGLPGDWIYHGIRREVFVVPLAQNVREFLRGEHDQLQWFCQSETELFEYFRDRWMLPRASRDDRFRQWRREEWMLWGECYPRQEVIWLDGR